MNTAEGSGGLFNLTTCGLTRPLVVMRSTETFPIIGQGANRGVNFASIATLTPDNYTAIVRRVDNTTGVALVEVYALN
jgi:hypothetical protein